ncbi:MAG: cysteine peptidase family C39 domain-containing protein [Planctomycetota bacterium]
MTTETVFAMSTAAAIGLAGWWSGHRLGRQNRVSRVLFASVILLTLTLSWTFSGRLSWAIVMPWSEVIHWSNMMPAFLAFAAGLALRAPGMNRLLRPVTTGVLALLAVGFWSAPLARPLIRPTGLKANAVVGWRQGVCLQTHESSCGAASSATLLGEHGIAVNEVDMLKPCMTSGFGTEPLGLYRGLHIIGEQHGLRPRVVSSDARRWRKEHFPNVAIVRFKTLGDERLAPWLHPFTGFIGAATDRHAVTVLGRTESGDWRIADPAVGPVIWTNRQFHERFTGDAICMSPIR